MDVSHAVPREDFLFITLIFIIALVILALLFPSLYEQEAVPTASAAGLGLLRAIAHATGGTHTHTHTHTPMHTPTPTAARHDHPDFELKAGMGRVVILLLGAVEHALLLLFVGLWFALPRYPRWVRL